MIVAKELGLTLRQLHREMTYEEVALWHVFLQLQRNEEEESIKKARRGRR